MRRAGFRCLVVSPGAAGGASLAVAAARAGAAGILDLTFCDAAALARVHRNAVDALRVTTAGQELGIRVAADSLAAAAKTLALFGDRPHTVIVTGGVVPPLERTASRTLLLEIVAPEQIAALPDVDGVVVSGRECGGWTGRESGFILLQRVLDAGIPAYVRGVAGPRSVAACRAAGAAGFVLDDQLLLMPESPLPPDWRVAADNVSGHDTTVVGEKLGLPCRIWAPKRMPAVRALAATALELEKSDSSREETIARWKRAAESAIRWDDPAHAAWPAGQALDAAAANRNRYRSTADLIADYLEQSRELLEIMRELRPFAPDAPLARDHGTRYPVVQGPMTRVSDVPEFARAVGDGGGLPLLAFALLRREQVRTLMEETRRRMQDLPWGVGLLGFADADLRRAQIAEILEQKPPFALIAGGRPEQVAELEAAGIPTYLHVPVPSLLRMFLADGVRRFVFEGRESGGHVGPLSSLHLWERMVEALLESMPRGGESSIGVLFAGGIHDARSALMASVIAAPLALRGVRVGVLMGTAYLFTAEAVASGAIVPEYQNQAIACRQTVTLESAPGQENRCAVTPFAQEFQERRLSMLRENTAADEIRRVLDDFTIGRLRVATKGIVRRGATLVRVDTPEQQHDGMYMLGEAATLRESVGTIASLHDDVCRASMDLLVRTADETSAVPSKHRAPSDVAIIGIGTLLPGAPDSDAFWRNVLDRKHSLVEVPPDRFDVARHFDPDPKAPDRTYSKWGGFFDPILFDPARYGMPPNLVPEVGVSQLLAIELTRRALDDAGYAARPFDREHTAVIISDLEHGGELDHQRVTRTCLRDLTDTSPPDTFARIGPDSFPGVLGNVTPGRIANVFDLGGANYSIDAACGSSLAAIDCAVRELDTGRCNLAIAGGIDTGETAYMFINFAKAQALSPTGQPRCFDKRADGIVISEGVSLVVLKRLADAERDGDRIYAVIKSVAGASDGRAKGITAPRMEGQVRTLRRAYEAADVDPATIGYYEAHGTGTALGDRTEAESMTRVLAEANAPPRACAIGSVKNLIGHTKTAAGATGLVKAALALHHRVLPPQADVNEPLDVLADANAPLYLLEEPAPWLANGDDPRHAGVSAFGFGGTNFHAVLEEYTGDLSAREPGAHVWPAELIAIRAADASALNRTIESLRSALERGARPRLADLAFTLAIEHAHGSHLFAAVVSSLDELQRVLREPARHVHEVPREPGLTALLFPGQGSQYLGAAREPAMYFSEIREMLERAGGVARLLYPPLRGKAARAEDEAALTRTDRAQPVLGAIGCGYARLMNRLGLPVAMAAGHSYGEYVALHFAGAISTGDLLRLSAERGRIMAAATGGAMLAVHTGADDVAPHLTPNVVIAACNRPQQTIVSGPQDDVRRFAEELDRAGIRSSRVNVSGAFHSPAMAAGAARLAEELSAIEMGPLTIPVFANTTAQPYENDPGAIRDTLSQQLVGKLEFVREIESMYERGARIFVEAGPGRILTESVAAILGERPHVAIALDPARGTLAGLLESLARLLAAGVPLALPALHRERGVRRLDLQRLVETTAPPAPTPTTWRLNGTRAERINAPPAVVRPRLEIAKSPEVSMSEPTSPLLQAYLAHQETMRHFLTTQEQVLRAFAGNGDAAAVPIARPAQIVETPAPVAQSPAPAPPPATAPAASPAATRESALAQLASIVAGATGYSVDMIEVTADIEAELGVDSIRRTEILSQFAKALPPELGARAHEESEKLARSRTLAQIVDVVFAVEPKPLVIPSEVEGPRPPVVTSPRFSGEAAARECPRFVVAGKPVPLDDVVSASMHGLYIVTAGEHPASAAVMERLRAAGADVIHLLASECNSLEAVERMLGGRVRAGEPVAGVIHLAPLGARSMPADLDAWRHITASDSKSLFWQLSYCARHDAAPRSIVAATLLGGRFGRDGLCGPGLPIGGGNLGLLRTYALERPAHIRCLDFSDVTPPGEIARNIVRELRPGGDDSIEIGYPDGVRTVFAPVAAPLHERAVRRDAMPHAGDVVLVTGGARGITAEVAAAIAEPGMTMVLIGRARLAGESADARDGLESVEALRQSLIDKAARAGIRRTPAEIEAEFRELLREREIHRNLDRLRSVGVNVQYRSVDVRDGAEFSRAIQDVYDSYGRIDAVIHGAGAIADKLLEDKKPDAFELVYDTKVDSMFLLYRHLRPESLRLVVLFTSIAGRFGSRGQTDYAAANEVLNRFAWRLRSEWQTTRVISINWNPWSGTGLANDLLNRHFRERGIIPISIPDGTAFAVDEILKGGADEVEIIAGEGPWAHAADAPVAEALSE